MPDPVPQQCPPGHADGLFQRRARRHAFQRRRQRSFERRKMSGGFMATIRHDLAVADLNDPPRLFGDPPVVCHDDDGMPDSVQLVQNGH